MSSGGEPLPIVASAFTPYQLLFLERVWAGLPPRPLLLIDARPARFRAGRAPQLPTDRILALDLTGKVNDAGQARAVRHGIAAAEEFVGGRPCAFLCASYQWPLNNVFYHRHRRDPNWHFLLIEDGLSTFVTVRQSLREDVRNLVREGIARLRGFPRRSWIRGHPLGLDLPELRAILLGSERLPAQARPYLPVPAATGERVRYTPDAALFVGQPYVAELGMDTLKRVIGEIRADLAARGYQRIGFKPHHYQSAAEVALYTAAGFELVDPPVTAEEMIAASEFRTVAAINSTALLTVKSLFGDGVRAISYAPSAVGPRHERRDAREIEAVFRDAGVEIVPLNIQAGG